jgi:predicted nucleic acid-binding protein
MTELVIDASVAVKWVVQGEPFRHKARALLRDAKLKSTALIGPPLLEYEVESVLQSRLRDKRANVTTVNASLNAFYAVGVQIVTPPDLLRRARSIARQFKQDYVYDSVYAALAALRGCEFWTADKAFYDTVRTGLSFVKYLPTYVSL